MTYLIFSAFIFILVTVLVPKNISKFEMYTVALFSIILGFITDTVLDLHYNLYGYFKPGFQYSGFIPILTLFPCSGILFINFYPYHQPFFHKMIYIFGWTIFCLLFEFLSIKSGYFYHSGWKYWYSAIVYPLLLMLQILHMKLNKKICI